MKTNYLTKWMDGVIEQEWVTYVDFLRKNYKSYCNKHNLDYFKTVFYSEIIKGIQNNLQNDLKKAIEK